MRTDQDQEDPFEIDTTVAHAARRHNYWLGGQDRQRRRRGHRTVAGVQTAAALTAIGRTPPVRAIRTAGRGLP